MISWIESQLFRYRTFVAGLFLVITLVLGYFAARTIVDASFNKQLPVGHEYIENFKKYQEQFGGANRVVIALVAKDGDMFTPEFFKTLKEATDETYYIPGVDRAQVTSIYTPNVRYIEVVEEGLIGSNVIPADFVPTPDGLERVRQNIIKSGRVGQLVANDFSGAIIVASLLEVDPATKQRLNYKQVADALEVNLRAKFANEHLDIHVIGFAKVIGDITDGARGVLLFFGVSFVITALLLFYFSQSIILTIIPLITSTCAVIWQMGLLNVLGFGIDPLSILVPFLVFAIGMSHATQMLRAFRYEFNIGQNEVTAARGAFRTLLIPGSVAITTDTIGFITIYLVKVPIIQELAITASLGVGLVIFTNMLLLPVLLSYTKMPPNFRRLLNIRRFALQPLWKSLVSVANRRNSIIVIAVSAVLFAYGIFMAPKVRIGDLHAGVPELRQESRYNVDTAVITKKFSIGVDVITVLVETVPNGVIEHDVMSLIDRFGWHMRNVEGVQSILTLTEVAKNINSGWNEGSLKWRMIPRNQQMLAQAVSPVETATGLLNNDGSVIPVLIYLKDHKAETIIRVVAAVKDFRAAHGSERARFQLATGNVGVMAATNEVVSAAQFPMVLWVYATTITLCLLSFRSWRATVCIVLPLIIVSSLGYALMVHLEIGLKTSTLPVVALGVGIGVDYGIYLFSTLLEKLRKGEYFEESLYYAFSTMGTSVFFTGSALAIGVGTWAFSALKFQADMGVLLAFMFLFNMLGALLLLPALARWLFRHHSGETQPPFPLAESTEGSTNGR
ncbi:MAG: MMPL family transporter [Candidatus Didemnitutus sp.]|nr:MMPL family transporter [Candidatus Didemnitutus sp.]